MARAERDLAAEEAFPELRHREVDEDVFAAGFAGELPELITMVGDDEADGAVEPAAGAADLGEAIELAHLGHAAEIEEGLPEVIEEFLVQRVPVDVALLALDRCGEAQLGADVAPIDAAPAP